MFTYKVFDLEFQNLHELPYEDKSEFHHTIGIEHEAGKGKHPLTITFVKIPQTSEGPFAGNNEEIYTYCNSTYFGADESEKKETKRGILGEKVDGISIKTHIPHPGHLEAFIFTAKSGQRYYLGIRIGDVANESDLENIVQVMLTTLVEK